MSAWKAGAVLGAAVAGGPLYALVQAGGLDSGAALVRGAVVAAGCALGATVVSRIAGGYERDGRRRQRLAEADRAIADLEAVVHEGRPVPPTAGPSSGAGRKAR